MARDQERKEEAWRTAHGAPPPLRPCECCDDNCCGPWREDLAAMEAERDRAREVALRLSYCVKGTYQEWYNDLSALVKEAQSWPSPITEQELKDRSYQNERFMGGG